MKKVFYWVNVAGEGVRALKSELEKGDVVEIKFTVPQRFDVDPEFITGMNAGIRKIVAYEYERFTQALPEDPVVEDFVNMRKLLLTPLTELELSVRAFNCLKAAEVRTLGDLVCNPVEGLVKFRNFGKKSLDELNALLVEKGLEWGMDVDRYFPELNEIKKEKP